MTDQNSQEKTELQVLKERAATLGIQHSNNIGVDALRKKINEKLEGTGTEETEQEETAAEEFQAAPAQETVAEPAPMTKAQKLMKLRQDLRKEALKLVRVRIACLDPKKKDLPGEIITTGNKFVGTVSRFVPFGEGTDDGWHIPHIIYELLKERQFLQITHKRNRKTGTNETRTRYVREFSIEVLPPLTEEELAKLAIAQQSSGRIQDDSEI